MYERVTREQSSTVTFGGPIHLGKPVSECKCETSHNMKAVECAIKK